jgi:hypothetical protein
MKKSKFTERSLPANTSRHRPRIYPRTVRRSTSHFLQRWPVNAMSPPPFDGISFQPFEKYRQK